MAVVAPLPPLLTPLAEQLEEYLVRPDLLPIHDTAPAQRSWPRVANPLHLLHSPSTPSEFQLKAVRDPCTGEVVDWEEVTLQEAGSTPRNSSSLLRAPAPPEEATRGSASSFPFWPGGFDPPQVAAPSGEAASLLDPSPSSLLSCPPGFAAGLPLPLPTSAPATLNLASLLPTDEVLALFKEAPATPTATTEEVGEEGEELEGLEEELGVVAISSGARVGQRRAEWAEMLDSEGGVPDFHQQVPQMAFQWPFELDTFQKQAVLKLEQAESVFVAAHTSAGKTVVAEYAIALSQKHLTRTIYTSPIKALSNQKFRDFKDTFTDVGLVTGDIQINPAATCLIMTTEILRSMLYNGSDIIRDLEWVVFDEVHYINDPERGVVWEEVLILLPEHVGIIMLSATVPNTLEFADWVGRTKQRKIWVISTPRRPVPLEHFLYTGSSGKTRDERFLLQDASGAFLKSGYNAAAKAKKDRESKGRAAGGGPGVRDRVGANQEKGIWLTLIDHLQRQDKLPVVAFTLSRARCDTNAGALTSLDLTSNMEKSDIHHFIARCTARLKGPDRRLPQVLTLTELLKRGIGVHHSGILPILKEVVECCFAQGWVKLLFATETFAMGVNMPARTVVFDNIRKHDGKNFRTLLPAEYIQMAGRAGRRGLDSTGTVVLLCKGELWELGELHSMMQGRATKLESKFRLTYSMILNLLRVEQLRVEDMMKRSFAELDTQKQQAGHKERGEELKKVLETLPDISSPIYAEAAEFYRLASQAEQVRGEVWSLLLALPTPAKALAAGRLVVVVHRGAVEVAVVLATDTRSTTRSYTCLLPGGERGEVGEEEERRCALLSLAATALPAPDLVTSEHRVVTVPDSAIRHVLNRTVRVEADKVVADVRKREIPRFQGDPPGAAVTSALQALVVSMEGMAGVPVREVAIDPLRDMKVQDLDLLDRLTRLDQLHQKIHAMEVVGAQDFPQQFHQVYQVLSVREEVERCEYLCSEASLALLPEYHVRCSVLRELQYVDGCSVVQLKGRVACEMGSNELIITELVFMNQLTERPPAEIAALLSCMVFQQRNCAEPSLTPSLEKGVKDIKETAARVGGVQVACGLQQPVGDYVDSFNFGLVEVVHEWARGMPFADITQLTDVQEGVIVRTIQRLDETLRDVKDAARVIGDPVLYQKMDEASSIIKRDIVFAASLYTQ